MRVTLKPAEREYLETWSRSRTLPHSLVRRAQIVLQAADGKKNQEIALAVGLNRNDVGKWRRRFTKEGLQGLYDQLRPGRPRSVSDEAVTRLIRKTLKLKPREATHWSTRLMSEASGVSKSTVHRVWTAFGLQPHRQTGFKLSNDPFFVEKVRDIVGLYLNPPGKALVLCVDEKSQCQALERTQPMLPMGLGYVEGVTHDYVRHGTLTLFAALDVATGQVLSQCRHRHRHQEFLSFLQHIDQNVPDNLDVHLVMDNYGSHKHPRVRSWLLRRPRYHIHFTPTYSSWLNQVEQWFGLITQRAIRRGSFRNVKALIKKIDAFVREYNRDSRPFSWTATADSILKKLQRLCTNIYGTLH